MTAKQYLWTGARADSFDSEWWTVGDRGYLHDGMLHIFGRGSEAIVTAAGTVYPHQLERALTSVPGVDRAMVTGLLDAGGRQRIVAGLVPSCGALSPTQIRIGLEDLVEPALIPHQFFKLTHLPLTDRGKPSRRTMADWIRTWDHRAQPIV
jgi:acyl-CoA synthetase (AMP-forming)/AMP-acid ligase II